MPTSTTSIEQTAINAIRTLSMDAVQAANSGHPGTPMALAPIGYTLWNEVLNYDPSDPLWPGRDRFVLSCGHASTLIYSLIHLAGVCEVDAQGAPTDKPSLSMDEIRNFRQWNSRTPGHPELGHTTGVETTTGPLGQGCANSVGMAMAERWMAARYNRPEAKLFDYNVYVLCSDGDLMEGISSEAASLAGHLKLSNLCWIYDDNKITIEGETDLAFSEDVAKRFEGFGWNVLRVDDANDLDSLRSNIKAFQDQEDRPTIIIARTEIGFGSPNKAGTAAAHGAPLGEDEIRLTKAAYGWPEDEKFSVPAEVYEHFQQNLGARGREQREAWQASLDTYKTKHPELAAELDAITSGKLPEGWDAELPVFPADEKGMASRKANGAAINALAKQIPWFLGGSADLAPSNNTLINDEADFSPADFAGRNFRFGIREHAMAAATNGMAIAGLRPFAATFFVFSDYLRPSMRLAALMGLPSVFVFTHDSIGVGEDGPTHQPVEQMAAARAIPNLIVLRPCDANESVEAWRTAMLQTDRPVALIFTRQNLPTLDREKYASASLLSRGAYVLSESANGSPQVILIGTGSEVSLCLAAQEKLAAEGVSARVVSMPSWELFQDQDPSYQESVLPSAVQARVAVEAGIRQGWDRYLGFQGQFVGVERFGASAPAELVYEHLGVTVESVVAAAKTSLNG